MAEGTPPNEAATRETEFEETLPCENCAGEGWYADHTDECYGHGGDCICSGVQVECDVCR